MKTGIFDKKVAPNKHLVQDLMYASASTHFPSGTDGVILLGQRPELAIKRAMSNVIKNKVLHGFDIKTEAVRSATYVKHKHEYKNLKIHLGNVADAPCVNFQDIDFCGPFVTDRRNMSPQLENGTLDGYAELAENDSLNILMNRLCTMKKLNGYKVLFSTVMNARANYGKRFSFIALDSLLYEIGYSLVDIDGLTYDIGQGDKISTTGCKHENGSVFHAYKHTVRVKKVKQNTVEFCKFDVYTYTDTTPMLTFSLVFK